MTYSKPVSADQPTQDPSLKKKEPASPGFSVSALKQHQAPGSHTSYPIVAHCHLLWDWVWQRPQQFLSRLADRHPVLYVETHPPSPDLDEPTATVREIEAAKVTVLKIQFPLGSWGNGGFVDRERRRLVQETLTGPLAGRFESPVQWFYDPMAVTAFLGRLDERAVVYDCMDELSKFKHAPPEIIERERQLLSMADVVFTGGRKLWEAKRKLNPNCHFYGCGVDVNHFARSKFQELAVPTDIRQLSAPILGYFGVIDERLDYDLIRKIAEARPGWNIVLVGPTTKVSAEDLPQRSNIHWLGGRPYSELPAYAKAFDVCLMPFALNEATEFINPTKALEYMATGKPVVSTPVPDVVSNFAEVAHIASSPEEFLHACEESLQHPNANRIERGEIMARENTWESVVARLEEHVAEALALKKGRTFSHATHLNLSPKGGNITLPLPAIG